MEIISHKKHHRFLILLVIGVLVVFAGVFFDLGSYFNTETIRRLVMPFGIWAPVIFVLLKITITSLLIPGSPMTITSGVLFGPIAGGLYATLGATIGSSVIFLVTRHMGAASFQSWLGKKSGRLFNLVEKSERNGFLATFLLRLVQIFPFSMVNVTLGLTRVRFRDFFWGTFFGLLPSGIMLAYFGGTLLTRNLTSISIAVSLIVLSWLVGVGFGEHYRHKRKTDAKKK